MNDHDELILAFQRAFGHRYRKCNIGAEMLHQSINILGNYHPHSLAAGPVIYTIQLFLYVLPEEDFSRTDIDFGYGFPLVQWTQQMDAYNRRVELMAIYKVQYIKEFAKVVEEASYRRYDEMISAQIDKVIND